jgi:hypothetical protein
MLGYIRANGPEIVIVNNEWWVNKISNDRPNAQLNPLFTRLGNIPIFSLSYYETARAACDYTIFSPQFEYYYELSEHIGRVRKQAPKSYKCDIDCSYEVRGGPEIEPEFGRTTAEEMVMKMRYIWEQILSNNEEQELYYT